MTAQTYDVAIIGAGVVGCAVFRELSLNGIACVLLERSADILDGASKGNSAILHTGFDAPPGSLEVRLMQAGRARYLADRTRLGLPMLETDAVLVAWSQAEVAKLPAILDKAIRNGVTGAARLDLGALHRRMPQLSSDAMAALQVPGEHIIDPWSSPLAYVLQAIALGGVNPAGEIWITPMGDHHFLAKRILCLKEITGAFFQIFGLPLHHVFWMGLYPRMVG